MMRGDSPAPDHGTGGGEPARGPGSFLTAAEAVAGAHQVLTCQWTSMALKCEKRVTVLAPASPTPPGKVHPVLILLHGYGGSRQTWLWRTRLTEHLRGTDLLVVLPESGRRWFINDHAGRQYEDYLIGELVPYLKSNYPVARNRAGWAIGGFSMGGAAALMQVLRHPDKFSAVVSHAGAFEAPFRVGDPYSSARSQPYMAIPSTEAHEQVWGPPESATRRRYDPYALIDAWDARLDLWVYADTGSGDFERIIQMNRNTISALRRAGISVEYYERQGAHDLEFLDGALPFSLDFLHRKLATG